MNMKGFTPNIYPYFFNQYQQSIWIQDLNRYPCTAKPLQKSSHFNFNITDQKVLQWMVWDIDNKKMWNIKGLQHSLLFFWTCCIGALVWWSWCGCYIDLWWSNDDATFFHFTMIEAIVNQISFIVSPPSPILLLC